MIHDIEKVVKHNDLAQRAADLKEELLTVIPVMRLTGSRQYGTHSPTSDWNWYAYLGHADPWERRDWPLGWEICEDVDFCSYLVQKKNVNCLVFENYSEFLAYRRSTKVLTLIGGKVSRVDRWKIEMAICQ